MMQEQEVKSKREETLENIKRVKEIEEKLFREITKSKYEYLKSDAYFESDSYIKMVGKGNSTGCLIEGSAGIGKTTRTFQTLEKMGLTEGDIGYIDSFTTPAALYIQLYNNRDRKALIIDDVAGVFKSEKNLGMFKGALWDVNGKRIVSYHTTKPLKDEEGIEIEGSFEMDAGVIFLTNELDQKSPHVLAVLSRINYCNLKVSKEELFKIMEQICQKEYGTLTKEERFEVFNFLKKEVIKSVSSINLRTLIKSFQFRQFAKDTSEESTFWQNLVLKCLKRENEELILETILSDETIPDMEAKAKKYTELTNGQSRATFFRRKKELLGG